MYVLSGTNAIYTIDTGTNAVINNGLVIGGQASGLSVSPISDRLYVVGRAIPDRLHQLDADSLSTLTSLTPLSSQNASITGPFLSPLYVTGNLSFPGDAALDAQHFGAFVNLWGGVLNVTSSWTTTRTVSVIPGNGANVISHGRRHQPGGDDRARRAQRARRRRLDDRHARTHRRDGT